MATDCLYSLSGGQPGLAFRNSAMKFYFPDHSLWLWVLFPAFGCLTLNLVPCFLDVYNVRVKICFWLWGWFLACAAISIGDQFSSLNTPFLQFLFTWLGRGRLWRATDCLYSLSGGWPGLAYGIQYISLFIIFYS